MKETDRDTDRHSHIDIRRGLPAHGMSLASANPPDVTLRLLVTRCVRYGTVGCGAVRLGARGTTHDARAQEWESTINGVATFCREALSQNAACCLDNGTVGRVQRIGLRRPETAWTCSEQNCWDELAGTRGEDILWVPGHRPTLSHLHVTCASATRVDAETQTSYSPTCRNHMT